MKKVFIILSVVFMGWWLAVKLVNKGDATSSLQTADTLLAKAPADSAKITEDDLPQRQLTLPEGAIDTKGVKPEELLAYAKTKIGVPYQYGSTNPEVGFDCSGFITHVFSHFGIVVPRSSIDFTNIGKEIPVQQARPGDLILFTGTDSTERFVGHMGIVESITDTLRFIHSTSGKAKGVTITPLNKYYQGRYVKTIRIF